jgi:hypothetical protein
VTGHFEDKTIVACCRSEVPTARLFIRVQYRVRSASEIRPNPAAPMGDAETGDRAMGLFDDVSSDPDRDLAARDEVMN